MVYTEILDSDKQALQDGSAAILTKIIISPGEEDEIVLTESDAVKTWEYTEDRYVEETSSFIGEFISREVTGELQNISDDFNIENKIIEVQFGVMTFAEKDTVLTDEDGNELITESGSNELMRDADRINIKNYTVVDTNWYTLGTFNIMEPEDDEVADNTKFDAMDNAVLFNQEFDADYTDETFTTSFNDAIANEDYFTLKELAQYTCAQVGVTFGNATFSHSTDLVTTNQFTGGDSCRDVMKAISKSAFGWCAMGWDNMCYIEEPSVDYENISEYDVITSDHYYELTDKKEKFGPVNRVVIGMEDIQGQDASISDNESIEEIGVNELDIFDNPLTYTQELRDAAIVGADKLFGLEYIPFETETLGQPWLKAKNPVAITDMEGNIKYSYPFHLVIKYSGHIRTDVAAVSKSKAEERLQYDDSLYKELRKLGIIVDRAEGVIREFSTRLTTDEATLQQIETNYERTVTDTYSKEEIRKIVSGVGVDGTVVTSVQTNSATFDENGMTYDRLNAPTKTTINEVGVNVKDANNKSVQFSGYVDSSNTDYADYVGQTIVGTDNIIVNKYLNIGTHSRIQDYKNGTGIFIR